SQNRRCGYAVNSRPSRFDPQAGWCPGVVNGGCMECVYRGSKQHRGLTSERRFKMAPLMRVCSDPDVILVCSGRTAVKHKVVCISFVRSLPIVFSALMLVAGLIVGGKEAVAEYQPAATHPIPYGDTSGSRYKTTSLHIKSEYYTLVGMVSGFAKGWTHIASADTDVLLFYNASTGAGATAKIDSSGNYTFIGNVSGFSRGWTHLTAVNRGALLFYNASTGAGA